LTVLTVETERNDEATGEAVSEAIPFHLERWQCFVVGSLFGWKNAAGHRRFRRAYLEIAKGNGKSPMAAGIGHYMLTSTGKLRAEVYSAATDRDQAMITFRDAVAMWERSPELHKRMLPSGRNPVWQLTYLKRNSFFKPISSEKKGKSGIRPYCALVDEVHEHRDNSVIEMLRAGTKGNQQALIFEITNSGFDRKSVCRAEHEYTVKVVERAIDNDAFFGFICSLDEGDKPFEDETCWIKANPNLGVSIHPAYIQEQVLEAKGMPSKEALVRRLHFCEWTDAANSWITQSVWSKTEDEDLDERDFEGAPCWLGLDLAYTTDLASLAKVFEVADHLYAFVDFWKPIEGLREAADKDGVPYDIWVNNGHLFTTPGKVIKLQPIAERIAEAASLHTLRVLAYDRYRHKELDTDLQDLGIIVPMMEHPQGFRRGGIMKDVLGNAVLGDDGKPKENPLWMPDSVQELENAIIEERLTVKLNPVLRWNVASVVIRDDPAGTGNRIMDKRKSTGRIDGAVSLAMAAGAALRCRVPGDGGSVYDSEDFFI